MTVFFTNPPINGILYNEIAAGNFFAFLTFCGSMLFSVFIGWKKTLILGVLYAIIFSIILNTILPLPSHSGSCVGFDACVPYTWPIWFLPLLISIFALIQCLAVIIGIGAHSIIRYLFVLRPAKYSKNGKKHSRNS